MPKIGKMQAVFPHMDVAKKEGVARVGMDWAICCYIPNLER